MKLKSINIRKITLLTTLSVGLIQLTTAGAMALSQPPVYLASELQSQAENSISGLGGGGSSFTGTLSNIVTIISYIAGIVAVIAILNAGFKYITSQGDPNKVGSAKTSLVYACIGIALAAIAQVIVNFAIASSNR